ncbi:MAG: class I SAM-dependent methyltransferase [Candidatus Paceibacterota bacterium]|jgi:SAM-dependent methyltransferase
MNPVAWWSEEYGFFGEHYLEGDNSKEGYLMAAKQSLEERTATEVDGVIWLAGLKGGEKILDIPSGYGRHSIALAKKGFSVTGSELNSVHLNRAIQNAKSADAEVKFVQENMIDITYQNEFDVVINMFYSFGFFDIDEENNRVLMNFYNALKPGGKFLFHTDVNIPRVLSGKYREDETRQLVSGKSLRIIDKYDPTDKKIHGTWIIKEKDGNEEKRDYVVRVYTREEFMEICKLVGFKEFQTYSDWSGAPYSEDSEDMIIIAEK